MVVQLKLAIHVDNQKSSWKGYEKWAGKLAEISGKRIKISIAHSGFVGIEEWNMLKSRQCDIARIFTLNMAPFPMHTVPALPFLLPDSPAALSILNSIYTKYLYKEWQEVKVLWLGLMSPWHLHTVKKLVRTLEDFRGLKIQASGLIAELVKAWGGIPVELTAAAGAARQNIQEVQYNALRTGLVDGTMGTFEVVNDFKLYEVAKYHTLLTVIRDVNATAVNLQVWNKLPLDIQKIFEELSPWAQQELDSAQAAEVTESQSLLKESWNTLINLTREEKSHWVKAAGTMVDKELAKLDAEGVPASLIAKEIRQLAAKLPK